ncbi:MAG TPA: hypothetical protein VF896_09420, partial [Anaerolineales bacterium]
MNINQLTRSILYKALILLLLLISACAPKQISTQTATDIPLSNPVATQIPTQEAAHGQSTGGRAP